MGTRPRASSTSKAVLIGIKETVQAGLGIFFRKPPISLECLKGTVLSCAWHMWMPTVT